jgi:SAM-dependent methyltransferase
VSQPEVEQPAVVESPDCPLCGSTAARALFVARDRLLGRPGAFPVVRCAGCGLVYLRPRPAPAELGTYYPDVYYPIDADPSPEARAVAEGLLARVTSWVREHRCDRLRLLDVGCGTGLFLHLAQNVGMRVQGIEPGAAAVTYARMRYGLDVRHGTLEDARLPDASFDVITLWHVLEHLPDPIAALRRAAGLLAPGGLLLAGVPNFASIEARVFGRRWYSLDAPRHLYHFTPETLGAALIAAGLRPQRIVHSTGTAGLVYSVMGDLTGVSLKLRHRPLAEREYQRSASVLRRVAAPLCMAAARIERGGALEVYATKPA